ncbi:MAG: response regulator [Desulfurivibrionaceae bacterium]|nr:response regulator [Desulfobulbales bacterium]MDT8335093.1 response regulator [Desulfurivibrionaceae bacterium]
MPPKVLLVDDEANILLSLQFLMQQEGYEVLVARNGDEAMAIARRHLPDLAILDVMLPGPNGYEVCQAMRAEPRLAGLYILMLTAKSNPAEREKGLAMGADDYVSKPFSNKELVDKVRAVLGSQAAASRDERHKAP